jgi:LPXTG-motif cell wall-anchored protein
MTNDSRSRRRVAAGLASMTIGAVAVVAGLAAPAGAHEGKEPADVPETNSLSCAELADKFEIDADWTESKIEADALPAEGESADFDLTPDDTTDSASVTITMNMELKNFDWDATIGIDAVYVKGGSKGSYFYGYQPEVAGYNEPGAGTVVGDGAEAMSDVDLGTPPYKQRGKNEISHVTFCWDTEGGSTTSSSTTSTTECPDGTVDVQTGMSGGDDEGKDEGNDDGKDDTPPPDECENPSSTTSSSTTAPPNETTTSSIDLNTSTTDSGGATPGESTTTTLAITPASDELPETGSNTTTPLILGGVALLALGGGLVAGNKLLRRA